jgi:hypothetical protein
MEPVKTVPIESYYKLELELKEEQLKNEIMQDRLYDYISAVFNLELKLKFVNDKLDEYMKKDEKSRTYNTPKIIDV